MNGVDDTSNFDEVAPEPPSPSLDALLSQQKFSGREQFTRAGEVLEAVYISDLLTQKAQHLLFIGRQLKKKGKLSAAYSTNGTVKVRVSDARPAQIIAEVADYSELLGAGDSQLQEVLSACGHPPTGEGAAAGSRGTPGAASGSKAAAAGAWVHAGHKSGSAPDTVANRPQTRSSSQ